MKIVQQFFIGSCPFLTGNSQIFHTGIYWAQLFKVLDNLFMNDDELFLLAIIPESGLKLPRYTGAKFLTKSCNQQLLI